MKINYIKNLNHGTLEINELTFWKALAISFLFDLVVVAVRLPIDAFNFVFSGGFFYLPTWFLDLLNETTNFIFQFGAILIIILFINRKVNIKSEGFSITPTIKEYIGAGVLVIAYIMITYGWFDIFLWSMPTMAGGVYEYLEQFMTTTPWIIIFIETCIMAPIFEELLYRGILLNGLLKRYSAKKAIIFSALIFAVAHLNLPQGINAFFIGAIIGLVYYYTKSIYVCIFMHFVNNLLVNFVIYPESKMWTNILFITVPLFGLMIMVLTWKWLGLKKKYKS